jgi:hypothetical protein
VPQAQQGHKVFKAMLVPLALQVPLVQQVQLVLQVQLDQQVLLAFKVTAQDSYTHFLHQQVQATLAVVCLNLTIQHWHLLLKLYFLQQLPIL